MRTMFSVNQGIADRQHLPQLFKLGTNGSMCLAQRKYVARRNTNVFFLHPFVFVVEVGINHVTLDAELVLIRGVVVAERGHHTAIILPCSTGHAVSSALGHWLGHRPAVPHNA